MISESAIGIMITLAAAAFTLWKGFAYLKHYRLITGTPTSRIRSAHQGYVEITGHIIEGEYGPLIAPLSGRECAWYRYSVSHLQSSGKTKRWRTERSGESDTWFQVNDGTATGLIDPAGATVRTINTRTWYGDTPNPNKHAAHHPNKPTMHQSGFDLNKRLFTELSGSRYRYQETLLFTHEQIYALGQFQSVGGGRHLTPLQQLSGEVIREWKQSYNDLLQRFDRNNDKKLDMPEWSDVQKAAQKEAVKRRTDMASAPTMHVLCCPTDNNNPFLISTFDEERLAIRYGWYALAALLALIGEGALLHHFLMS
ncbi:GIDE domain-containing protein [Neptunomonas sp.]|uniref:GIDE domain-containing protein n=1 Tax=Neptunomonas sp. TaxID=1971898 RepID=UPI003569A2BD